MGWTVLGLSWGLEKYYFFHYPIMAQQCFFGRGGCSSILTSKWWLNRLTNTSAPLINPWHLVVTSVIYIYFQWFVVFSLPQHLRLFKSCFKFILLGSVFFFFWFFFRRNFLQISCCVWMHMLYTGWVRTCFLDYTTPQ